MRKTTKISLDILNIKANHKITDFPSIHIVYCIASYRCHKEILEVLLPEGKLLW